MKIIQFNFGEIEPTENTGYCELDSETGQYTIKICRQLPTIAKIGVLIHELAHWIVGVDHHQTIHDFIDRHFTIRSNIRSLNK
jgi:hypothetical protein